MPTQESIFIHLVNFNLDGMSQTEFEALCDQLAPVFANIPGLLSKIWLADPATNSYGGVYVWQNRQAFEAYSQTELFHNVVNHPNFANITARAFGILAGPTEVTHGIPQVAA